MQPQFMSAAAGETADLGIAQMRLLLSGNHTAGHISAGEFRGAAGPWTVRHLHRDLEEIFYVVDGVFTFWVEDTEHVAEAGALVMIPRGTPHVFRADRAGTLLVLWTPAGLENMFLELGRLPADSITDSTVRAEISKRYDSMPVSAV